MCKYKQIFLTLIVFTTVIYTNAQKAQTIRPDISLSTADSFYFAGDWDNARTIYKNILKDTSHNSVEWNRLGFACYNLGMYDEALSSYTKSLENKPSPQLQPVLYSRIARVYAMKNDYEKTLQHLDSAIQVGYSNAGELDTLKEFTKMQHDEKFKALKNKAYSNAFPCNADPKKKEFDFWIGGWDVFQTGTTALMGHSIVQQASGGCMVLENWTAVGVLHNGKSMNFIDQSTNKWEQVWVGSEGSGVHRFVNGEYRDSAMRFEFEQTNPQGKKLKGKFTFFNQGPNQVRQLNEVSADDGKTWNTNYDFTYIRKK